ncbi:MAG: tetratricopeptide repeat protein [Lautropia sp.]
MPSVHIAVPATLAFVLCLALAGGGWAQAPLQSSLAPTGQTRPQDSAQAALRAGNPQRALDIADTALKTFPTDAQFRFIRGMALNALNRLPAAEAEFAALTREFPELPEPYNNLAVVRAAQGNLDQARQALEDAIRAVPNYAVAYENLGDIHAQLAARSYQAAQRLDPTSKTIAPKLKLVGEVVAPLAPASGAASNGAQSAPARRP